MRKRLKIGQEVVFVSFDQKTCKETLEKGTIAGLRSFCGDERAAIATKGGVIIEVGRVHIFTKWDEKFVKQEEE